MATDQTVSWKKTLLVSALLLIAGGGVVFAIFSTEPTASRGGATKKTEMLVDVVEVERGTFRPTIVGTGTVRAEQDVVLSPRVSGAIVWRSPDFTPGKHVEEGEALVRIDPVDYRNTLAQRRSDLRQALTALELEEGRRSVAEKELDLFDKELSPQSKKRALRVPQLEAAQVRAQAARAAVEQARIDLSRTRIEAPFSGQILSREVSIGSRVAPGDPIGRLVGVERYWVVVTLPRSKLRWLSFRQDDGEGAEVRVRNRGAWPEGAHRNGYLDTLLGALDEQTRMVRVIASIPDPLARGEDLPEDTPVLMIGDFLETRIVGEAIADVVRLDREQLRKGDTVWVFSDGNLEIREVEVVARDEQHVYVAEGLDDGDRVVTTDLSTVTDGAPLRLRSATIEDGSSRVE